MGTKKEGGGWPDGKTPPPPPVKVKFTLEPRTGHEGPERE